LPSPQETQQPIVLLNNRGRTMSSKNPPAPQNPVSPQALEGDLVQEGDPRYGLIWINPERLSGEPCFFGTRVPVRTLFEYIEAGDSLDDFLVGFPGVTREQAVAVLELARKELLDRAA
jgi:uncharacterized protein (DUF433 family)